MNDQGIGCLPSSSHMTLEKSLTVPDPQAPLCKAGYAILFTQVTLHCLVHAYVSHLYTEAGEGRGPAHSSQGVGGSGKTL